MYVRQREQGEIVSRIGDIFLNAATEFRLAYPTYIGQLAAAEKRLKEETENNGDFRVFLEVREVSLGSAIYCRRLTLYQAMLPASRQCEHDGPQALAQPPPFGTPTQIPSCLRSHPDGDCGREPRRRFLERSG